MTDRDMLDLGAIIQQLRDAFYSGQPVQVDSQRALIVDHSSEINSADELTLRFTIRPLRD